MSKVMPKHNCLKWTIKHSKVIRKGRCNYACAKCGKDISFSYLAYLEAEYETKKLKHKLK